MGIIKIIGIALVTAISVIILKNTRPELAFVTLVAGSIIVLLSCLDEVETSVALFKEIASITGVQDSILKILIKIIGIGYLAEFAAGILNDFGSSSLGDKVVLCGKLTILVLSIPILQSLLTLINGFLDLV